MNFKNLVFEGGGVKGIAYGGALQELQKMKIVDNIQRVAGTSAGAITATLLAVGYSASEVCDIIAQTDFAAFADDDLGVIRDTRRLLKSYGWHKGDKFLKWIGRLIKAKTGNKNLTFRALHDLSGAHDRFKSLYVVGTNLSSQEVEHYSHESSPKVEIRHAVRISMSIPLYFRCVRNIAGDILVDGGVTCNYPINIFDHKKYLDNADNGEPVSYNQTPGFVFNHETLGFRLDESGAKEASLLSSQLIPHDIDSIYDYGRALVSFMRQMASQQHLHKNDWARTINIDSTGISATDFNISEKKIKRLINSGATGVKTHFNWRQGPDGIDQPTKKFV